MTSTLQDADLALLFVSAGISPILRLVARPEVSRVKSTFNPLVLKKEVACSISETRTELDMIVERRLI